MTEICSLDALRAHYGDVSPLAARKEIGEILEQKVHLFLFVKVRENWGDDPERYREMGLDFPG